MPVGRENKLPQRPAEHRREDVSRRSFEALIPPTWSYTPSTQREYGIDGVVEVFDGDEATGLRFNVQLKGSEASTTNRVIIKTSTTNYWKLLDSPTLVTLVDSAGDAHYQWAHLLDPYGKKAGTKRQTWHLKRRWDEHSASEIESEVRAARAASNLAAHLPVFWSVSSKEPATAPWVGQFRAALERLFDGLPELTLHPERKGWAIAELSTSSDSVAARLHGRTGTTIHYSPNGCESAPPASVAADGALALAVELKRGGLDGVAADLTERAISESRALSTMPDLAAFATRLLADNGRSESVRLLVKRVYLDEEVSFGAVVPVTLAWSPGRLSSEDITAIAETVAAKGSAGGANSDAGTHLYNAGNMIRRANGERGIEFYTQAAERAPSYRRRGYWWRELGEIYFNQGQVAQACEHYETAHGLGDSESVPLLADSYATLGRFQDAVRTWSEARGLERAIWILKARSLESLAGHLSLGHQARDPVRASELYEKDAPGVEVLRADALHLAGLWRAGAEARAASDRSFVTFYLAAAAFAVANPMLWFEALLAIEEGVSDPTEMANLRSVALVAASQECGAAFRQFLLEDDYVSEQARETLLELVALATPENEPRVVVRVDGVPLLGDDHGAQA